jgi:hypothetical protein
MYFIPACQFFSRHESVKESGVKVQSSERPVKLKPHEANPLIREMGVNFVITKKS